MPLYDIQQVEFNFYHNSKTRLLTDEVTYPNLHSPQTTNLHKCNPEHCEHCPFLTWHSRRLVLATIRLSGVKRGSPTAFSLPPRMANLPSSKRTLGRTESARVKLLLMIAFRLPKSKPPRLSHRVFVINFEMIEVILKRHVIWRMSSE